MGDLSSKQFVFSRSGLTFPGGEHSAIGEMTLVRSPDLPIHDVNIDGQRGVLLGWPLHLDGRSSLSGIEHGELGGRHVFISDSKIIHDALGSYAVVFSSDLEAVASTSALFPAARLHENRDLNAALDLPAKRNWYPFGLTPYSNVERLQPNHVLDLRSWQVSRQNRARITGGSIDVVVSGFTASMDAIRDLDAVMIGVTAGNETRMLIAGLRGHQDVYGFTFGSTKTQDAITGRAVAQQAGLRHEIIRPRRDESVSESWFERIGRCVTGASMINAAGKEDLPRDRWFVKGMGGEIGRGFYYRPTDTATMTIRVPDLVSRLKLPPHRLILEAGERWLARLEPEDSLDVLDQLYADNRTGCWSSPQIHGDTDAKAMLFPLNKVSILRALRGLPESLKFEDQLAPMIVKSIAPDLLRYPLNEPFGAARIPWVVKRALRKMMRK